MVDKARNGRSKRVGFGDDGDLYLQAVRSEILRRLTAPVVDVSIKSISRSVDLPVRTLQRRLSSTGTTFRALIDECRHEKAVKLLGEGRYTVAEVGARLGYSDAAHFARAFRRWSNTTPSDCLKRRVNPAIACKFRP